MIRIRTTVITALLAMANLVSVAPARAVDVRQPDTRGVYASELARAYAACTAPNTVTSGGLPACAPAVTSACKHLRGSLEIRAGIDSTPSGSMSLYKPSTPAMCTDGDYVIETGLRYSGDYTYDPLEAPCPSALCTWADVVTSFNAFDGSAVLTLTGADADVRKGNFAIAGLTIFGPDGLPEAAPGIGDRPLAQRFVADLTVPIEPCTTGPVCDLAPWTSPCDFESGYVEITRTAANLAAAHVVMRDVAGTSPVCLTGVYTLEATVRGTVESCGTPASLCTLPDTTVTVPLVVQGRNVDGGGALRFATPVHEVESTQILGIRVLDPTGLPVATVGLAGVEPLPARVTVKGDALRVQATIPLASADFRIDPATEPGLTVTVEDRDGVVYAVTIPEVRWQLQPPIGSRWTYADKGGVLNGVRKARVKRFSKQGGTMVGYEIDVQVKGVDLSAADHASLTVKLSTRRFLDLFNVDDVFDWQGTRTCTGAYPKLTCK